MSERKQLKNHRNEDIIRAFDREQAEARDLGRRHAEQIRSSRDRDRQVLIERRRNPR